MAGITLSLADLPSWQKFVNDFATVSSNFQNSYSQLLNLQSYVYNSHPELRSQYDALVQRGQQSANNLMLLKGVRDTVAGWIDAVQQAGAAVMNTAGDVMQPSYDFISDLFGNIGNAFNSGVSVVKQTFGINGLGAIPIAVVAIGAAAALAALAVIAAFAADAYKMNQRLTALKNAEAQGYTPQAAANLVDQVLGSAKTGLQAPLGVPLGYWIAGAALLLIAPPIIRMALKDR